MRVARLELKEIGPFEDAVLEIPPPAEGQRGELVIFEGPNGSGKTTIAQAIACLATPPIDEYRRSSPPYPDVLHEYPDEHRFVLMPPLRELMGRLRSENHSKLQLDIEERGESFHPRFDGRFINWHRQDPPYPEPARLISRHASAACGEDVALRWAAFAFRGHQSTPIVSTKGPSEIDTPPLRGALSFGAFDSAASHFGQLLTNLNYERAMAFMESHRDDLPADRRGDLQRNTETRRGALARMEEALSAMLDRAVRFEFPLGQHHPTILFDGEPIAPELLGEGMRSTLAWLADLMVRLHRISWEDAARSPLEQEFWLILDEIDESLHPRMQMRVVPTLRRLFPNARLYITTHSPFVVASAGEGYVFAIRPDQRRRVSGRIEGRKLEPGQSLEWVVEEIFDAETGFLDPFTRDALRAHRADISRLRRKEAFSEEDWRAFLERRAALMRLNEQVQTVVAMQEVPVQRLVTERLGAANASGEVAQ